jgi:hypothetical protein
MSDPAIVARFLAAFGSADMAAMRELTQPPVPVDPDLVLALVEVHAERDGRTLHNFAAHLLRLTDNQIAEWWMADAKPAESDSFWGP